MKTILEKDSIHLDKFCRWIQIIQQNISTYKRTKLKSSEQKYISDFGQLYNEATNSYFLTILRTLIDSDSEVTSIITFSEDLLKSIANKGFQSKYEDLDNFGQNLKSLKKIKTEVFSKYNIWMNEYNSHLNSLRLDSVITATQENEWGITITYKQPPIDDIILEIEKLFDLFQKIIFYASEGSWVNAIIYNNSIEYGTKIQIVENEI